MTWRSPLSLVVLLDLAICAVIPVLTKSHANSLFCEHELHMAMALNYRMKIFLVVYQNGWGEGEEGRGVRFYVVPFKIEYSCDWTQN